MLPPILPSPTKPICVTVVLLDPRGQRAQRARGVIALQPHALGGQPELAQRLQVADRLRVLERGERVGAPGISTSRGPSWSSCRKRPVVRPALVELAGGVQEARAVAERGRRARARADRARAARATASSNSRRGLHVGHDRDVVRRRARRAAARAAPRRRRRRRRGSSPRRFVARRARALVASLACCTLGWSNGLISQAPAGDRDGELGEQEHAPEVARARASGS